MHRMMPSHHHSPLTICTKRLIKCLMCHIWRLLTDPRSLLTTTRRMLRHSSDCTHRDTSVRSAAQCLRIQATNAAILGLRAPRMTSRWSSVIFAPQALNHNGFVNSLDRTSSCNDRRPDRCTPDTCVTSTAGAFWLDLEWKRLLNSFHRTSNIFNVSFATEFMRWSQMFRKRLRVSSVKI